MNCLAAEFSWEYRYARIPKVAVGDDNVTVISYLACRQMDIPASIRRLPHRIDSNNVSTSFSSARPATEVVRPPEGLVPRSVPDGLTHALIDLSCCLSLDPSAGREHRTARFHLAAACDPRRA